MTDLSSNEIKALMFVPWTRAPSSPRSLHTMMQNIRVPTLLIGGPGICRGKVKYWDDELLIAE